MTARDLFGVIVRLIGYGLCLYCVLWGVYSAIGLLGLPRGSGEELGIGAWAAYLVVGVLVIASAGLVTRLLYGREPK